MITPLCLKLCCFFSLVLGSLALAHFNISWAINMVENENSCALGVISSKTWLLIHKSTSNL